MLGSAASSKNLGSFACLSVERLRQWSVVVGGIYTERERGLQVKKPYILSFQNLFFLWVCLSHFLYSTCPPFAHSHYLTPIFICSLFLPAILWILTCGQSESVHIC